MQLILLQKVENLGNLGDIVSVRAGYGRNYLIPQGKASEATAENLARFETRRVELEKAAADTLAAAERRREQLDGLAVTIAANAGNEGRLYGSVNVAEIAAAVNAAGVELHKSEVILPDGPLRTVGEFDVVLRLHSDVETPLRVNVVSEQ